MSYTFKIFGTTADVGIEAFADTLDEVFSAVSIGMYNIYTDVSRIKRAEHVDFTIEEEDLLNSLISILNEFIYISDTKHLFFTYVICHHKGGITKVHAEGQEILNREHLKVYIKAATYHNALLNKDDNRWHAKVIFDI
ncbi:MAG: archease [Thermoplasmata archaeon]